MSPVKVKKNHQINYALLQIVILNCHSLSLIPFSCLPRLEWNEIEWPTCECTRNFKTRTSRWKTIFL